MQIEQVTVEFGRTHSTEDYSNIKSRMTLTAQVEPGDELADVVSQLSTLCETYVEDKIDGALMQEGLAPHYYRGPRFRAMVHEDLNTVAIIPQGLRLPAGWRQLHGTGIRASYQPLGILMNHVVEECAKKRGMDLWESHKVGSQKELDEALEEWLDAINAKRRVDVQLWKEDPWPQHSLLIVVLVPWREGVEELHRTYDRSGHEYDLSPVGLYGDAAWGPTARGRLVESSDVPVLEAPSFDVLVSTITQMEGPEELVTALQEVKRA